MRQAAMRLAGCLALLLVVFGTSGWGEAAVTLCNDPGNSHVVNTDQEAADVAAQGYDNSGCNLIIALTLPTSGMALNLNLTANTLVISGPAHVNIINDTASSSINIQTIGNISILNASLKAHKNLIIDCSGLAPDCTFTSDNGTGFSELIVAKDPGFDAVPLGPGGVMHITSQGPFAITDTAIHAGDTFHFTSNKASVTLGPCPGGTVGVCTDPTVAPFTPTVLALCGNPPVFPCAALGQLDTAGVKSICIPQTPGQPCNGGFKQKEITAATFIDIRNTQLISNKHVVLTCGTELLGSGANIEVFQDKLLIKCGGKVDLTDATLSASLNVEVTSSCVGVTPGTPCIDATGANVDGKEVKMSAAQGAGIIDASNGSFNNTASRFPTLNGDFTPPYPASVLTTGLTVCRLFGAPTQECQSF